VDHKTALELYYTRRNQHLSNSFASVLSKQQTNKTTTNTKTTPTPQHTKQNNDTQATHEHQKRKLISYPDLLTDTPTPTQFTNTTPLMLSAWISTPLPPQKTTWQAKGPKI